MNAARTRRIPGLPRLQVVRSDVLARARDAGGFGALSRARDVGEACPCVTDENVALLMELGMPKAAGMHAESDRQWHAEDWRQHALEEDTRLFDLLETVADRLPGHAREDLREKVTRLRTEHKTAVYPAVARGEVPEAAFASAHGAAEDALLTRYSRQLRAAARAMNAPAPAAAPVAPVAVGRIGLRRAPWGAEVRIGGDPARKKFGGITAPGDTPAGLGPKYTVEDPSTVVSMVEKFIDPHFSECWTRDPGGIEKHRGDGGYEKAILSQAFRELYDMRGDQSVGLEYLGGVANTAAARVAAMRAKINTDGPGLDAHYGLFRNASYDGFSGVARAIAEAVKDPSKARAIGQTLGLPIAEAEDTRREIIKWLDTTSGGAIVKILWSDIGPRITKMMQQTVGEIVGESKSVASSLGAAASAAGPLVSMLVQVVSLSMKEADESHTAATRSTCSQLMGYIGESSKRLADAGLPGPWHLAGVNCDGVDGGKAGTDLDIADGTARATDYYQLGVTPARRWAYGDYGDGLSPTDQVALKKWWALAQLLWLDDRVGRVMQAMGNDYWKGELASDEQVMLIAAPIAVANGLDVDDFARKLWDRSKGWRSRPELFVRRDGSGCGPVVDNARFIQFAVLAREAFELAEGRVFQIEMPGTLDRLKAALASKATKTVLLLVAVAGGVLAIKKVL